MFLKAQKDKQEGQSGYTVLSLKSTCRENRHFGNKEDNLFGFHGST